MVAAWTPMIQYMQNQGACRRGYSLGPPPRHIFRAHRKTLGTVVPIFQPYEENLPLESGYYSFVIDEAGRFRVKRGNLRSHSSMVDGAAVGAAGHFRINRAGNVAEVSCRSYDYRISIPTGRHPAVGFVLDAFANHHAFDLSPWAIFHFSRGTADTFVLDAQGRLLESHVVHLAELEREGQGDEIKSSFSIDQIQNFKTYLPTPPPKLYPMHVDQMILAVEGDDDIGFEFGPPMPRFAPEMPKLCSGKKAFIFDKEGWLVIGMGHHLLSGGQDVGAAGQIVIDENRLITEINLNFSGHYRPPLDGNSARYVHVALRTHPLLEYSENCRISGRKFDDSGELSTVLRFDPNDLTSDDVDLDFLIEVASL